VASGIHEDECVAQPDLGSTALAALAFWLAFVGLAFTYWLLKHELLLKHEAKYALPMFLQDLTSVATGTLFSVALGVVLRRTTHLHFKWQIALAFGLALLASSPFDLIFRTSIYLQGIASAPSLFQIEKLLLGSLFWIAPLGLWTSAYLAFVHASAARLRERHLTALQIEAHEAKVRALRYQINPHFLYNTLNSIAALILDGRNDLAEKMVLRLASFFRVTLTIDPLKDVTLGEEIAIQLRYLDVEQLRFEDSLLVEIDVLPEVEYVKVPSLILQPLVENALKHGVREPGQPMLLRISARRDESFVQIEVSDNGPGRPTKAPSTGLGLKNVAHRLSNRFGGLSLLETFPHVNGFMVRLRFPFQVA
jgi:signal transduction histidine kinase